MEGRKNCIEYQESSIEYRLEEKRMSAKFTVTVPNCFSRLPLWFVLTFYRLRYGYSACFIHIQKFHFAIVDPADYDLLRKYKWRLNRSNRTYYAFRTRSEERRVGKEC